MFQSLAQSPLESVILLGALSILPFAFITMTSFLKISIVFSILKSALGAQVPSNMAISALSGVLTLYVMMPVFGEMEAASAPFATALSGAENEHAEPVTRGRAIVDGVIQVGSPLVRFMGTHSLERERRGFLALRQRHGVAATRDDFMVILPAFLVSELTRAFQIGFLVFLPFLVIDIVIANILMALGMHMLSPTNVSMPFKLMLFVLVDGWHLLSQALVLGYG